MHTYIHTHAHRATHVLSELWLFVGLQNDQVRCGSLKVLALQAQLEQLLRATANRGEQMRPSGYLGLARALGDDFQKLGELLDQRDRLRKQWVCEDRNSNKRVDILVAPSNYAVEID